MENIGGTDFLTGFHDVAKSLNLILIHKGTIASIPSGYHLCDGNAGTIDLRNIFIVGADADAGGVAKTTITGVALQTGGDTTTSSEVMGATIDNSYTGITDSTTGYASVSDSGHTHNVTQVGIIDETPKYQDVGNYGDTDTGYASVSDSGHYHMINDELHNHNVTDAGHTHTAINPFYALAFIQAI